MKKHLLFFALLGFSFLTSQAANFTSTSSGSYTSPSSWTFTGFDADGRPDQDDNVTITNTHTMTLTSSGNAGALTINPGGVINLNGLSMLVWGDFTNNGSSIGLGGWQFRGPGTYTGNNLPNIGNVYFFSTYTIGAGVVISKNGSFIISNNCTITNNGFVSLTANGVLSIATGARWINAAGSVTEVSANVINNGLIDASANSNIFRYLTNYTTVMCTNAVYYNLALNAPSAGTKTLNGDLVSLNNITYNTGVTLDWGNNNISIGGSWRNFANTNSINMGTITFNGSGVQTIQRLTGSSEVFNAVTFAGSGTVQLQNNVRASGTTTLSSGILDPAAFVYSQRGASWIKNGGSISLAASGRVAFIGTTNQTIGGTTSTTFGNLEINNPGFTVTCLSDQTARGTTTLTAGTLSPGAFIFHQRGASWLANGGAIDITAAGEIQFNGTSPQTIGGTAGATFGNLEISSTSTVTLARDLFVSRLFTLFSGTFDVSASSFAVNLAGNFVHDGGSFTPRAGTVIFNGTSAQLASGSATTTFNNITSDNTLGGVAVTKIIIINGILQVNSNSFGTTGIGNIILTAPAVTTFAKIGPLGAGATLTGTNWSIGSFIDGPAPAYWQYLGSPVSNSTLADWDNDARFYMSGVGGNDGTACCPTFFSVRTYNTASNTYTNITTTSTALTPGRGFMVWMSDNMSSLTIPLSYDTKGTPNFGTVVRAVTAGGSGSGYNLVSNPYACAVTYSSVVASSGNLHPNFLILQENGSYATNPNGGTIAPNQGFMCIALVTGTIKFLESNKNVAANPNIIRSGDPENYLRIISGNTVSGLGGETVVNINPDAHNGKDLAIDMPYLPSPYEDATNVWTNDNDGETLLLNALDGNQDMLDIPLTVSAGSPGDQLLTFKGLNGFSAYSCAWLIDDATEEKINLKEHDTYSFHADAAGEKHTFTLHFERDGNCPLNEQMIAPSLDASSQVFVNNGNILVKFGFEEKSDVVVTVFNVSGQEVGAPKSMNVMNETILLDSPGAHGIYLVRIVKGDEIVTKKIYY
ncbi:hypothetical protein BH11BAC7_BH11BAC7_18070 [soil metagenome]